MHETKHCCSWQMKATLRNSAHPSHPQPTPTHPTQHPGHCQPTYTSTSANPEVSTDSVLWLEERDLLPCQLNIWYLWNKRIKIWVLFLYNKINRRTNFPNIFCQETPHVSGSSSAHPQEFSTVHSALVCVMQFWWQLSSRTTRAVTHPAFSSIGSGSDLAREKAAGVGSWNLTST